jgi:hypothetical protein
MWTDTDLQGLTTREIRQRWDGFTEIPISKRQDPKKLQCPILNQQSAPKTFWLPAVICTRKCTPIDANGQPDSEVGGLIVAGCWDADLARKIFLWTDADLQRLTLTVGYQRLPALTHRRGWNPDIQRPSSNTIKRELTRLPQTAATYSANCCAWIMADGKIPNLKDR